MSRVSVWTDKNTAVKPPNVTHTQPELSGTLYLRKSNICSSTSSNCVALPWFQTHNHRGAVAGTVHGARDCRCL